MSSGLQKKLHSTCKGCRAAEKYSRDGWQEGCYFNVKLGEFQDNGYFKPIGACQKPKTIKEFLALTKNLNEL